MPIHPTAIIDPSAEIDPSCEIGPYAVIGANCVLGENNIVMQSATICANTRAGRGNTFYHHSLVGGDPQFLGFDPKTNSGTAIGDGNHFREFSQVHRGLKDGQHTILGNGNYLMATSHVAHDCVLGDGNILANYAGLAGHVTMGDKVFVSTLVGIHQFCRVGSYAMIGGRTGISKDIPPYVTMKHYGEVVGLNVVGLRRAGINQATRTALKDAYRELFRSGAPLTLAIERVRGHWEGQEMPKELAHFLEFCGTKSKRGISHGPRAGSPIGDDDDDI